MYIRMSGGVKRAAMGIKQGIEHQILDLNNKMIDLIAIQQELWIYHPANPNFINPIKEYEVLKLEIEELECKINSLRLELNSLN